MSPDVTFSKIFGLPAHPLFVHVPVVLIPLVAFGTNVRLFQIGESGAKATWERVRLQASNDRNRAGRH